MKKNQVRRFKNERIPRKIGKLKISISCGASIDPFDGPVPPEPSTRRRVRTIQGNMLRTAIVHAVPLEHLMNTVNNEVQCVKIDSKCGMKNLAFKIALDLPQEDSVGNKVKSMVVPVRISKITPVKDLIKRNGMGATISKVKIGKGKNIR